MSGINTISAFYQIQPLPYGFDALEPYISRKTLEFHYGKHQQGYVNTLNSLVIGTKYENSDIETIIRVAEGPLFNNASQVWNHNFYFEGMTNAGSKSLKGSFARVISGNFGSVQYLKDNFIKAGTTLFGSGWIWLLWNPKGSVEIVQESNAGNPLRKGLTPLLTCDVWEHGYYLDYQNRRSDYLEAFWKLIDWEIIEKRYIEARSS
ncbi:MAG TPA: superoxide dismutase [Bacteroidales bacterium]|nr:superoxide dismutase [Bacteroidales bacterium]